VGRQSSEASGAPYRDPCDTPYHRKQGWHGPAQSWQCIHVGAYGDRRTQRAYLIYGGAGQVVDCIREQGNRPPIWLLRLRRLPTLTISKASWDEMARHAREAPREARVDPGG